MILRLDKQGMPTSWITPYFACQLIASDRVAWQLGSRVHIFHGGVNRDSQQSILEIPSIIATKGVGGHYKLSKTPCLTNSALFARDHYACMYCSKSLPQKTKGFKLTRDHIIPRGRGGPDTWTNVVTACGRCNHHKACRTPSEANMPLLAVPYTPNHAEWMVLKNRSILADQMDFLRSFCKHEDFNG